MSYSGTIGVSALGDDGPPVFDLEDTIISQYATWIKLHQHSPYTPARLLSMIQNFFDCVDQTINMDAFYDKMWNILSAEGYGLDVWGRIVGVGRVLAVGGGSFLGFEETGDTDASGWNVFPFYTGNPFTSNYTLSDPFFRQLILAKAFANICDGSTAALNQLLRILFCVNPDGSFRGNAYATDDGGMAMTYTFKFLLTPVDAAIIQQSGVLPRSTGVALTVVISP